MESPSLDVDENTFPPAVTIIETDLNVPLLLDEEIIKRIQEFQSNMTSDKLSRLTIEDISILLKSGTEVERC